MDEELYGISFKIIAAAGDAHSQAQIAVKKANQYEFEEAEKLIAEAKNNLKEAHKYRPVFCRGNRGNSCAGLCNHDACIQIIMQWLLKELIWQRK